MKILSNKRWNALQDLINEKEWQHQTLLRKLCQQQKLIEAQRRFISAHFTGQDIDFPNSERKEDHESSNIFEL